MSETYHLSLTKFFIIRFYCECGMQELEFVEMDSYLTLLGLNATQCAQSIRLVEYEILVFSIFN
jgi:hypothetical protein